MNDALKTLWDSLQKHGFEIVSVTLKLRHKNFSKKIVALLKVDEE